MKDKTTKSIVDTSILVALAIALKIISDLIPFLNFFEGGTIDLAMLPLILIGYRNGIKYGFIGTTLYWFIAWMIGGFKIYSGYPLVEIMLDRFVPYTIGYGISSLFYKERYHLLNGSLVIVLSGFIRLLSHTISGVLLWYSWTGFNGFIESSIASLIYNITYVGTTTILAVVLFILLNKILFIKAPLNLNKKVK